MLISENVQRTRMSALSDFFTAIIVGGFGFFTVVGFSVLDGSNILWLTTVSDTLTHYLGWEFFRRDVWHWPPGLNPSYGLEFSSSVIFSDSIPFLAIPFKVISALLPPVFQYAGLWLLLCFLLQAYFSVRLLRLVTDSRLVIFGAAVLFVFSPPFLWRLHGHFSLFAHWLVLAALLIYLSNAEDDKRRLSKWMLVIASATLVHTYLFAMIAVIWVADLFQRNMLFPLPIKFRLLEMVYVLGAAFLTLWVGGFFPLRPSYLSGGYGVHRFNILSLFNPQGSTSVRDQWSYFLPALPQGGGDYEGFNYLGVGLLIALGLGLPALLRVSGEDLKRRFTPLAFASLMLFGFAITNHIGIGGVDINIWAPKWLIKAANIMRASGRFFWPVFYLIALATVWLMLRQFGSRVTGVLLLCLAALQVYDTKSGWSEFHEKFHLVGAEWSHKLSSHDLDVVVRQYAKLKVLPAGNAVEGWDATAYLALRNGLSTDSTYLARADDSKYFAAAEQAKTIVEDGMLEMDSVYFLDISFARRVAVSMGENDAIFVVGGVYVYAPNWSSFNISVSLERARFF